MLGDILNFTLIASTIRLATPIVLAALGGLYSERGGVINIALEGIMLAGAFTAATVTVFTHSPWIGLLAAIFAGILVAAVHGVATIIYRADQVVSGTAINILFLGVPALLSGAFFDSTGATPQLPRDQVLPDMAILNPETFPVLASIFNQKPLVYIALITVGVSYYVLYYTRFGLRLRAVGENPEAADTAGISVVKTRYGGSPRLGRAGSDGRSIFVNWSELALHKKYDRRSRLYRACRVDIRQMGSGRRVFGVPAFWFCRGSCDQNARHCQYSKSVHTDHSLRPDNGRACGIDSTRYTATLDRCTLCQGTEIKLAD